jgi:hypothetical protein
VAEEDNMERQGHFPDIAPITPSLPAAPDPEEALVSDARAGVTPAQMVEQKLALLTTNSPLLHSRMRAAGLPRPTA